MHGVKIPLESFEITDRGNGEKITSEYKAQQMEQFRLQGEYPLYDDSFVPEHRQKARFISFRGFKDGEAVVSEDYQVAADCCHVRRISGQEILIIN